MPQRPSPRALKSWALDSVALNIELLCYGCAKGSKALNKCIQEESYFKVEGPFVVNFCEMTTCNWLKQIFFKGLAFVSPRRIGNPHLWEKVNTYKFSMQDSIERFFFRAGLRHLLHLVIQPHLKNFKIKLYGSTLAAMKMLVERYIFIWSIWCYHVAHK